MNATTKSYGWIGGASRKHKLIAVAAALVIVLIGYTIIRSQAAGTFASLQPESGSLATNAKVVADSNASGGKAVQFNAPSTPPPEPPNPTDCRAARTVAAGAKPSAANTGVPSGTQLTKSTTRTYTNNSNTVLELKCLDISGNVTITGKNIKITHSVIRGTANGSGGSCKASAALDIDGTNIVIEDSEVYNATTSACSDVIWASGATFTRVKVHDGTDGLKAFDNVTLQNSYVYGLKYFSSDPYQGGGPTHNDVVQSYANNSNIALLGNYLDASGGSAAFQLTDDDSSGRAMKNIRIEKNWLSGGGCTLNLANKHNTSMTGFTLIGNRFVRNQSYAGCAVIRSTNIGMSVSGNVWDDTGAALAGNDIRGF